MTREERAAISILNAYKEGYESAIEDYKQEPCDDAISRDAVIKDFTQWRSKLAYTVGEDYSGVSVLDKAIRVIKNMPSVTQKSGKWINDKNDIPICSRCGYIPQYDRAIDDYEYSNYCPLCGCRMVEPQESEDKE